MAVSSASADAALQPGARDVCWPASAIPSLTRRCGSVRRTGTSALRCSSRSAADLDTGWRVASRWRFARRGRSCASGSPAASGARCARRRRHHLARSSARPGVRAGSVRRRDHGWGSLALRSRHASDPGCRVARRPRPDSDGRGFRPQGACRCGYAWTTRLKRAVSAVLSAIDSGSAARPHARRHGFDGRGATRAASAIRSLARQAGEARA